MYNHINIIKMNSKDAIKEMRLKKIIVLGTNVENGLDIRKIPKEYKEKYCLIMGNEGNGVKKEIQELCDKNLYIEMNSEVESLNVSIACSIILYELNK